MQTSPGSTAVVTGAASGIGLARAQRAAAEAMEGARDGGVVTVRCDVSDPDQVDALAATAYDRFGSVELLCNSAGVGGDRFWIFTHPEMVRATTARQEEVLASLDDLP